jgi:hypothetical protein
MEHVLHVRERADATFGVYDDGGALVATVVQSPTTGEDFELALERPGGETMRRLISGRDGLGFEGVLRAEELVQQYYPDDKVQFDGWDESRRPLH